MRRAAVAIVLSALVASSVAAQNGGAATPAEQYLSWTASQAQTIGEAAYKQGRVGGFWDGRILKTERAYNYKLAATMLSPQAIRATARLLQLRGRLTSAQTRDLVAEAEGAGGTVVMVDRSARGLRRDPTRLGRVPSAERPAVRGGSWGHDADASRRQSARRSSAAQLRLRPLLDRLPEWPGGGLPSARGDRHRVGRPNPRQGGESQLAGCRTVVAFFGRNPLPASQPLRKEHDPEVNAGEHQIDRAQISMRQLGAQCGSTYVIGRDKSPW